MIDALKKIWAFAGSERKNLNRSVLLGALYAIFHALQIAALYVVLKGLMEHADGMDTAMQALVILAVSILGRSVVEYISQLQRVHAGYFRRRTSASPSESVSSASRWAILTRAASDGSRASQQLFWAMWRKLPPWFSSTR